MPKQAGATNVKESAKQGDAFAHRVHRPVRQRHRSIASCRGGSVVFFRAGRDDEARLPRRVWRRANAG